jgi:hypothetical protein
MGEKFREREFSVRLVVRDWYYAHCAPAVDAIKNNTYKFRAHKAAEKFAGIVAERTKKAGSCGPFAMTEGRKNFDEYNALLFAPAKFLIEHRETDLLVEYNVLTELRLIAAVTRNKDTALGVISLLGAAGAEEHLKLLLAYMPKLSDTASAAKEALGRLAMAK